MKDQKRIGISISYLNLVLSTIINVFLTRYIVESLGDDNYTIYKVMQSFAGPLIMFNLGVSTIVSRAIVKYETLEKKDLKEKQNTLSLAIISSTIMGVIVLIIGVVMCFLVPSIYGNNYSDRLIHEGQIIFLIFVFSTVFHILTDAFNGCAIGHERFAFNSGLVLLKNVIRLPLIVVVLYFGFGAIAITMVDFIIAVVAFFLSSGYALFVLKEHPKLSYVSKNVLFEMLSFSTAILLQAVVNQVNNNVDTMILGAMIKDKSIITMYSSALIIYVAYNSVVSIMSGFFLPKATKLITKNASGKELTDFVIKPGRYQALIAVAFIFGFIILGKDFIILWIGEKYVNAYYVVLILTIPVTIPLVENTAISILDASLKRLFRSIVLVVMAIINVLLSLILVKVFGFWGAALGTFISLCIGHILLMNLYYAKTFNMEIWRMFYSIFKGILPVGLLTGLLCIPLIFIKSSSFIILAVKGVVFCIIYFVLNIKWGLSDDEKNTIYQMIRLSKVKGKLKNEVK